MRLIVVTAFVSQSGEIHVFVSLQQIQRPLKSNNTQKIAGIYARVFGKYSFKLLVAEAAYLCKRCDVCLSEIDGLHRGSHSFVIVFRKDV